MYTCIEFRPSLEAIYSMYCSPVNDTKVGQARAKGISPYNVQCTHLVLASSLQNIAEIVDQYLILVLRHKNLASLSRAYKYDTVFQLFLVKSLEGQKLIHILIAFSKGQKIQNCKMRRTLRCVSWGPAFFEERCESDHGFGRRSGVVHERVLTHRNDTIKCC